MVLTWGVVHSVLPVWTASMLVYLSSHVYRIRVGFPGHLHAQSHVENILWPAQVQRNHVIIFKSLPI